MRPSTFFLLSCLIFVSCWSGSQPFGTSPSDDADTEKTASLDTDDAQDVPPAPIEETEVPAAAATESPNVCVHKVDAQGLEKALQNANILFTGDACPVHMPTPLEEIRWIIDVAYITLPSGINEEEARRHFAERAEWFDLVIEKLGFNKNLRYNGKPLTGPQKNKPSPFRKPIIAEMLVERLAHAIILEDEAGQNVWGLHLADYYASYYIAEGGGLPNPGVAAELYVMLGEKEHAAEAAHFAVELALNRYAGSIPTETPLPGKTSDLEEAVRWIHRTDEITGAPAKSDEEMADLLRNYAYRARLSGFHSAANGLHAYASIFDTTPIDDSIYGTSSP